MSWKRLGFKSLETFSITVTVLNCYSNLLRDACFMCGIALQARDLLVGVLPWV